MQISTVKKISLASLLALGLLSGNSAAAITTPEPGNWFKQDNLLKTAAATTLVHFILLMCKESVPDNKYKAQFNWERMKTAFGKADANTTLAQIYHYWNEKILGQRLKEAALRPDVGEGVTLYKTKTCRPRGLFGLMLGYSIGLAKGFESFEKAAKLPNRIGNFVGKFQTKTFDDFVWGKVDL